MTEKPSCIFDITHMFEILTIILKNGEMKASDVESDVSWRTIDTRLRWLVDDGILLMEYPRLGRKTPRYTLTPKGKAVAYSMCVGMGVYSGEIDFESSEFSESMENMILRTSMKDLVPRD